MKQSIGFIEYRSVAKGIEATDAMLKSGNVALLQSVVLCPGKFVSMITGDVGAVESAVKVGGRFAPEFSIDQFVIPNVHKTLLPALTGTSPATLHGALGIIETVDAASAIVAADEAAKAADIDLLEIRLARGMGGKGYIYLCGELTAVKTSVQHASQKIGAEGLLIATSVIAAPNAGLQLLLG